MLNVTLPLEKGSVMKQPQTDVEWGPIGKQVYERTYARFNGDNRKETWEETITRVVNGNCDLAPSDFPVSNEERDELFEMINAFQIMPAGRHLWVSGVPGRQFLFNCHRAGWDSLLSNHTAFTFEELMRGGGVGANYSQAREYTPTAARVKFICHYDHPDYDDVKQYLTDWDWQVARTTGIPIHCVRDSREGWTEALIAVVDAHFIPRHFDSLIVDVSDIRPSGARIKRFGGTSSGPGGLLELLSSVSKMLNDKADTPLSKLDLMSIDHMIARCVVAGNIRRSARMSIMHWQDPEIFNFINCKEDASNHWTTNISVEIDDEFIENLGRDGHADEVLDNIAVGMAHNGEPGIFNSSLASVGERGDVRCTNPCGEIALEEWENCNLGHLNLANLTTMADQMKAAKLMARFLVRATLSPDVTIRQRAVLRRNRRIGVGVYGFQEWLINSYGIPYSSILYNEDVRAKIGWHLTSLRNQVRKSATDYAEELGIRTPVKFTTVAPTGTISALSGHSPGVHPIHAKYFIRRIRHANHDEALNGLPDFQLEKDLTSDNTTIVKHICADAIMDRVKNRDLVQDAADLTISEQLSVQALVQEAWADNAVSYTVQIPQDSDWTKIKEAIIAYAPKLKGFTMFPEMSIPQAPIEPLTPVEFAALSNQFDPEYQHSYDEECANGACPVR